MTIKLKQFSKSQFFLVNDFIIQKERFVLVPWQEKGLRYLSSRLSTDCSSAPLSVSVG